MTQALNAGRRRLDIRGAALEVATLDQGGDAAPIVFLHGFGSTKEDYADIAKWPAFKTRPMLAYDAPGFGQTICATPAAVDIPFLVETAQAMVDAAGFDRFHVVGHSMGGLTALMLAAAWPERVISFANIEGNLAPEDCFLSRQIIGRADQEPEAFLAAFTEHARRSPATGSALFAAGLSAKVTPAVSAPIFTSMVAMSDGGGLLETFFSLPGAKQFVYGAENAGLSYLATLAAQNVSMAEIPGSGHWPMYSNPPALWGALSGFFAEQA